MSGAVRHADFLTSHFAPRAEGGCCSRPGGWFPSASLHRGAIIFFKEDTPMLADPSFWTTWVGKFGDLSCFWPIHSGSDGTFVLGQGRSFFNSVPRFSHAFPPMVPSGLPESRPPFAIFLSSLKCFFCHGTGLAMKAHGQNPKHLENRVGLLWVDLQTPRPFFGCRASFLCEGSEVQFGNLFEQCTFCHVSPSVLGPCPSACTARALAHPWAKWLSQLGGKMGFNPFL